MKKVFTKIFGLILAMVLVVTASGFENVSAASDYEPYGYVRKVNDKTKTFIGEKGKIVAECFCESFKLHGFKKGIKKINKALKKIASAYDCSDLYENARIFAEESAESNVFYNTINADVTYCDQEYFSVTFLSQWYAGGVSNINLNGIVFDINTGKKVSVTKLTGKKWNDIKNMLVKKIVDSGEFEGMEDDVVETFRKELKESDVPYYINSKGKVVMIIPEYTEPFYGGWYREYVLDEIPAIYEVQ